MALAISADEQDRRTAYVLGLTEADIVARRSRVGASDANIILSGDVEKIHRLWQVKRGEAEPEDLSDILAVQMGTWTEALNIFWFEKQTGKAVTGRKSSFAHPKYSHIVAAPEGLVDGGRAILECKHVGAFHYDIKTIRARYLPQLAVQMACCGAEQAYLSVFSGNNKWEFDVIERDHLYEMEVIDAINVFWDHVQAGTLPVDLPEVAGPVPAALLRVSDMKTSNVWGAAEAQYLDNEAQAKLFEQAKSSLKELVEPDVGEAVGRRLVIKRGKTGALSFSKIKGAKA